MKLTLLLVGVLFLMNVSSAQAPVGSWTDYQSYSSAVKLADTEERIYCVTSGGLFYYEKSDNSVWPLSSINGLSDVGIQTIGYGKGAGAVLIAYKNSNIDLIIDKDIYNLSDIKRKQIMGNKSINSILFIGKLAYLSCGFGIVVVNTEKKEIKDTYYIGEGGSYLNVLDMTSDETWFYAATEQGVYRAAKNEPNLQDYSNWHHLTDIPNPNGRFTHIENFDGKIVAGYTPGTGLHKIYSYNGNNWVQNYAEIKQIRDMIVILDRLIVSNEGDIYIFNASGGVIEKIYQYVFQNSSSNGINPFCTLLNDDGTFWIADYKYGLVRKDGNTYEQVSPDGPFDNKIFSLYASGENLWVASGGRDAAWGNLWNQARFQKSSQGEWSVYDSEKYPEMGPFRDIVCITTDPLDPEHVFAASWGGGVFEFQGGQYVKQHSDHNSSLQSSISGNHEFVRVGGMAFDKSGKLWVANGGGTNVLSSYSNETWRPYSIPELANKYNLGNMVVTEDGDKWIIVPRDDSYGLYVVNNDITDHQWQENKARFASNNEYFFPMHDVYSIAIDRDGAIWVGSSKGVGVYENPSDIWGNQPLYATQPGLELNDGIYHPLLSDETVTAIAVDGSNRKWFGTKNSGVFLISENGENELAHFTTENSPLLSNEITSIAINNINGEVFIGTSQGLISYMGEAIEPEAEFTDVYVYPNPVREDYDGPVVVKGLVENTDVKITDISGNLVFHGTSLGGQAVWDGKNQNGNRCHTGVYLVFLNNKSGEQTFVTKILFIH